MMLRRLYSMNTERSCQSTASMRMRKTGDSRAPALPARGTKRMSISLARGSAGSRRAVGSVCAA